MANTLSRYALVIAIAAEWRGVSMNITMGLAPDHRVVTAHAGP